MESQAANFEPIRFSASDLPENERIPVWREFFGRLVFRTEIEPAPDVPFNAEFVVHGLPGVELVSSEVSPARFSRTRRLISDGNDDIGLFVTTSAGVAAQCGRELTFNPGDAVIMNAAEPGTCMTPFASQYRCLHMRRAALARTIADLDGATLLRRVTMKSEPLRYLLSYASFIKDEQSMSNPALGQAAAIHLRDLFALTLGATGEAAFIAEGRGLRAARLRAIKRFVADHLNAGWLTVGTVAARHGVTPRYVQRLFESEGTTFSAFLLNQRLQRAFLMLANPRFACWTVTAIAMEAGFSDVSYFNRRFRRRFGASPTWFRAP